MKSACLKSGTNFERQYEFFNRFIEKLAVKGCMATAGKWRSNRNIK